MLRSFLLRILPTFMIMSLSLSPVALAQEPGFDDSVSITALEANEWKSVIASSVTKDVEAQVKAQRVMLSSDDIAHVGQFSRKSSESPQLLIVNAEKGSLKLYEEGKVIAQKKGLTFLDEKEAGALGFPSALSAVHVVKDGTTQLLALHKQEQRGKTTYHITLFKALGSHFGAPLDRVVARSSKESEAIHLTHCVSLEANEKAAQFVITPMSPKGEPMRKKASVLRWNHWEGVFDVPRPAPTSPRTKRPRS